MHVKCYVCDEVIGSAVADASDFSMMQAAKKLQQKLKAVICYI